MVLRQASGKAILEDLCLRDCQANARLPVSYLCDAAKLDTSPSPSAGAGIAEGIVYIDNAFRKRANRLGGRPATNGRMERATTAELTVSPKWQ